MHRRGSINCAIDSNGLLIENPGLRLEPSCEQRYFEEKKKLILRPFLVKWPNISGSIRRCIAQNDTEGNEKILGR